MKTEATNINQLINRCKGGCRKSQFELYRLYSRAMYNLCLRMLGNQLEAEDILQEGFVDIFADLEKYRGEATLGAWIKRIIIYKCIDHLKSKKVKFKFLDDNNLEKISEAEEIENIRNVSPELIHHSIKQLPEGCRVIFNLYMLEGYDHQEISQILKVSISTSKSQLHRAKNLLKNRLKNQVYV